MKLLTKEIEAALRANHAINSDSEGIPLEKGITDPRPVLKVFNQRGSGTWLFTELDDQDILYGLCDLGQGSPELGYQALYELEEFGLERDMYFKANKTLSEYASEARNNRRIMA